MITLGLQIVIILCLVYNYIVTKRDFKSLNSEFTKLKDTLDTFTEKIDNYNMSVVEVNNRIKSNGLDFNEFVTEFRSIFKPVEPKKFKTKDKELYEEELRENVNIYRG